MVYRGYHGQIECIKFGKEKHIAAIIASVNLFKLKLHLWISHLKIKSLVHFSNLKKLVNGGNFDPSFIIHLETLTTV